MWYSVVQCGVLCCSVLQCVAVCCSVLQCVAVSAVGVRYPSLSPNVHNINTNTYTHAYGKWKIDVIVLVSTTLLIHQYVAVCCSVLQCTVLQCVAVCCQHHSVDTSICMHIYMHTYASTNMHKYICIHKYAQIYTHVAGGKLHKYPQIYMHSSTNIYASIHKYMCIHKYAHIYTHMAGGKQTSSYLSALLCASYIQSRRSSALANHDHLNFTCSLSPSKQRSKRKISDWDQNGLAVVIIYPRSPPPVDAHFAHVCVYTYTHLWWVVN